MQPTICGWQKNDQTRFVAHYCLAFPIGMIGDQMKKYCIKGNWHELGSINAMNLNKKVKQKQMVTHKEGLRRQYVMANINS